MPTKISDETQLLTNPNKFAANANGKLLTKLRGEPPVNTSKGRRRNPLITKIYNGLIDDRNSWFHVNVPIMSPKQLNNMRASLYARAKKDNFQLFTSSAYNEQTKLYDLWVMLV